MHRRRSIAERHADRFEHTEELVGDRDPRHHELTVQLRAFDASRSGAALGLPALLTFCGALLAKSLKGGLVAVGGLNLGGGLDPIYNAVSVAELAVEKDAETLLVPISARRQLNDLSDEMAAKVTILYYTDARDALPKAVGDRAAGFGGCACVVCTEVLYTRRPYNSTLPRQRGRDEFAGGELRLATYHPGSQALHRPDDRASRDSGARVLDDLNRAAGAGRQRRVAVSTAGRDGPA